MLGTMVGKLRAAADRLERLDTDVGLGAPLYQLVGDQRVAVAYREVAEVKNGILEFNARAANAVLILPVSGEKSNDTPTAGS